MGAKPVGKYEAACSEYWGELAGVMGGFPGTRKGGQRGPERRPTHGLQKNPRGWGISVLRSQRRPDQQ